MRISGADLKLRLTPIVLSQAMGLVCGVIGVRLASHWIAPADYGRYGIFVSFTPLGLGVVFSGIIKFIGRHWAETTERGALLRGCAVGIGRKTPWLAAAVALATVFAARDQPLVFGTSLLAAALLLTVGQLTQAALQAERANWPDFTIATTAALTRSFLPPMAYLLCGASLGSLLGGFCMHALLVAIVALIVLYRRRAIGGHGAILSPGREYAGLLFILLAIAGLITGGVNRWIAAWFFGVDQAGYFTLASNIAGIAPLLLGGVALQFSQPIWFAAEVDAAGARRQLARNIDRVAAIYTLAALAAVLLLRAAMPLLIGPLVSEHYAPATDYIIGAGCYAAALCVGQFYHTMLIAVKRPNACGPVDLGGAVCLIAGAVGAAMGGRHWFVQWLYIAPAIPWLINRTLARRYLFAPAP